MNLLFVVTHESLCIWVEKHIFYALGSVLSVLCRELEPKLHSQATIMKLLFELFRIYKLGFLLKDDFPHLLNFLAIGFIHCSI